MNNLKINSKEEFIDKLHELSALFGFEFEINQSGTFLTSNGRKMKMEYSQGEDGFFYAQNNGQTICFNHMFMERCFGVSCLIEIFVTNGKDRIYCRYAQELQLAASKTTQELPTFTFIEYKDGKTHSFFSNIHSIETMESDALINPMLRKMIRFENYHINNSNKKWRNNYTRFLFGVNRVSEKECRPLVKLNTIKKRLGHSSELFSSEFSMVYNEWLSMYKDNPYLTSYDPSIYGTVVPFIEKFYSKTLKQNEKFVPQLPLPTEYTNLIYSIARKKDAVDCFNNSINFFKNSIAWPYISRHFSESIEYIRCMQNGEEYQGTSNFVSVKS